MSNLNYTRVGQTKQCLLFGTPCTELNTNILADVAIVLATYFDGYGLSAVHHGMTPCLLIVVLFVVQGATVVCMEVGTG